MATLVQVAARPRVTTPLGADAFALAALSASEALSRLFDLQLDVVALSSTQVPFEKLLGQSVTATVPLPGGASRYFNGIVREVSKGGQIQGLDGEPLALYRLHLVPQAWLLSHRMQSRIFQQLSVPEILDKVLTGLDVKYELQGTYEPRNYCTQYRESDLDFASRLMEEEGIYYFFRHADGSHTMVVADNPASHAEVPGAGTLAFDASAAGQRKSRVWHWEKRQSLRSGKNTIWDHSFELPHKHLDATQPIMATIAAGTTTHKLQVGGNEKLEIYDYPGGYAQRFDGVDPTGGDRAGDLQKIFQDNKRTVAIRMQEEEVGSIEISAQSDCAQLIAGHKFTLEEHADADGAYVVTSVSHRVRMDQAVRGGGASDAGYENAFTCIPAAMPYRPARTTPRPRVYGCQTAVVVGPSGEEIFTDKYGRVKVQFHWDREGKSDATSSCWLRVASTWAGKNWGAVHIPRIGQEVLVDFLEGDPDRPIVVGSVYNADQMPPYDLPANKTQSGVKSRSTLKGSAENFNEIRFEDKKGSEQIYVHAETNLDTVVENNETRKIGASKKDKGDQTVEIFNNQTTKVGTGEGNASDGSQTLEVYKDQTVLVKTGDQKVTVDKGNQAITVDQDREVTVRKGNLSTAVQTGNHATTVDKGNVSTAVKMGNHTTEVDMGNVSVTVKMGNHTTKLNLGKIEEEALQSIEMKVGQSSIKVDQMGVTIKGMMVQIEGQVQTQVKGLMTQVNGDAMLMVKGGITMIN
jgi:type VI secretion system secreted protein VgrG